MALGAEPARAESSDEGARNQLEGEMTRKQRTNPNGEDSADVRRPTVPAPAARSSVQTALPRWADDEELERVAAVTPMADELFVDASMFETRPVLVRLDGAHAGEVATVEREVLTVGRDARNDLPIDDPAMSRFHARLLRGDASFVLEDLGSRNGTFVSGERCSHTLLREGAVIQMGPRVCLRFARLDRREEQMLRQLHEASILDALTGTYNRKYLDTRLESEIAFAQRHRTRVGLILFDIDHFKSVNDTYGHSTGDETLRQVARSCQCCLRKEDVLARFGGEEFAVVLRDVQLQGTVRLAERLRAAVADFPVIHAGKRIEVTISAGCADLSSCEDATAHALIRVADERLYRAKQSGRNVVVGTTVG